MSSKGAHPLLLKYLAQLASNPLRTKAITTGDLTVIQHKLMLTFLLGTLCFLQEVVGSTISGLPVQRPAKNAPCVLHILAALNVDLKAFKMAIYGFLVSAPMGHFLNGALQKGFAGKTGTAAKLGQILVNSLVVSPINAVVFLLSMAVVNGAKTLDEVLKTIKAGFFPVLRVSWVVSPVTLVVAQKFIPLELWVPFFNTVQFVLGTFFNVQAKKSKLAAAKKAEREKKDREGDANKD
ncbi:hypothetical protein H0H81_005520 [Sphagnurus paluster]|uniref:Uncharacterized protein n=1 Tax=Sphagnurus paluster TaxID=117069 RepID=A0A9P7GLK1_9AGAR|nr:hypothetical protein H0H81_005520 [Sphagnurus paluster]